MYIIFVLMLTGVRASGTATLSFIFPNSQESEIVQEIEKVNKPVVKVSRVEEGDGKLVMDLVSRKELELSFDVLYDDGTIDSFDGGFIDGTRKLEVPVVLSGSRKKIRWVNILWEGDGLVVCNASHESLPDLSLSSVGQFEKN